MANLHDSIDPVAWQNPLHPDQLSSKPIPNWMPLYTAAPVAQQPHQCALCGSDEAFAGACGGGKNNPRALCYEPVDQQPQTESDAYCITTPDGGCISTDPRCMHQPQGEAVDWKAQYEHQKRRAERWIAKYEADIGPLEKAGPVAQQPQEIEVQCPVCNHKFYEWPNDKQPQAKPDIHEAQGQIEFLDKKNNALSAAIRKVMARLADLLDEDQFKEIEETISSVGVQPQAEAVPVVDRVYEAAKRLVDHADFQLGGVLSAKSKARDIPSNAASKVKARHLASLRDALAKAPQQAEAVPPTHVLVPVGPTEEMIQGFWGDVTHGEPEREAAKEAWRKAIDAAIAAQGAKT